MASSSAIWIAALLGLILILVLTRGWYRWQNPKYRDRDAYAHLSYIKDIREANHRLPDTPSNVVTGGGYCYPPLLHWLLSFLPQYLDEKTDRWFSVLMDLLLVGLVFLLIPLSVLSLREGTIAVAFVVMYPQLVRHDLSHGMGLSARKPGMLFVTVCFLFLFFWLETGSTLWIIGAILCAAAVPLTSKFSLQAFLAIAITFLIFGEIFPVLLFVVGLILATVFTNGYYWTVLWGQLRHLYDYAVNVQYERFNHSLIPTNLFENLFKSRSILDVLSIFYYTKFIRAIANNISYFVLIVILWAIFVDDISIQFDYFFVVWITGCIGAFTLTSLPHLKFLGQAERYLEYSLLPTAIIVSQAFVRIPSKYQFALIGCLLLGALAIGINIWIYNYVQLDTKKSEINDLIRMLNEIAPGVILVQPISCGREIAYRTDHKTIDLILNGGSPGLAEELNKLYFGSNRYITNDIEWLNKKYSPDYVIFDDTELPPGSLKPPDSEPLFTTGSYKIYNFSEYEGI